MTSADHRDAMERCIARNTALCACVEEEFAGGTAFSPKYGGIGFLAVRPEYRRRGIGSLLIREALSCMPQDRGVFVHVYPAFPQPVSCTFPWASERMNSSGRRTKFTRFWFSLPNG